YEQFQESQDAVDRRAARTEFAGEPHARAEAGQAAPNRPEGLRGAEGSGRHFRALHFRPGALRFWLLRNGTPTRRYWPALVARLPGCRTPLDEDRLGTLEDRCHTRPQRAGLRFR